MNELTVKQNKAGLIEASSDAIANLPDAISQLQRTIGSMRPDDLSIEFSSETNGDKSRTLFRFRAYRRDVLEQQ